MTMRLGSNDIKGICGMLPAFGTDDASSIHEQSTVDLNRLFQGVKQAIDDGIDSLATTMTSGEFHTLLWEEQQELIAATIEIARGRVPVLVACVGINTREALRRIAFARDCGADGVVVGVPYYVPATIENAIQFFHDVADTFPDLSMMIYHNPVLHRVRLPVEAFQSILTRPNIIAMKDSHRTAQEFEQLIAIARGRMSVLCHEVQLATLGPLGAAGVWSMGWWFGPAPLLALRDAFYRKDWSSVEVICQQLNAFYKAVNPIGNTSPLAAMERAIVTLKLVTNAAGYCQVGPLRPPFRIVPQSVHREAEQLATTWQELVTLYKKDARIQAT